MFPIASFRNAPTAAPQNHPASKPYEMPTNHRLTLPADAAHQTLAVHISKKFENDQWQNARIIVSPQSIASIQGNQLKVTEDMLNAFHSGDQGAFTAIFDDKLSVQFNSHGSAFLAVLTVESDSTLEVTVQATSLKYPPGCSTFNLGFEIGEARGLKRRASESPPPQSSTSITSQRRRFERTIQQTEVRRSDVGTTEVSHGVTDIPERSRRRDSQEDVDMQGMSAVENADQEGRTDNVGGSAVAVNDEPVNVDSSQQASADKGKAKAAQQDPGNRGEVSSQAGAPTALAGTGIVPQYHEIKPTEAASKILQRDPNISALELLEQLGTTNGKTTFGGENDRFAKYLQRRKKEISDVLANLQVFYEERRKYIAASTSKAKSIAFFNLLQKANFELSPLQNKFQRIVVPNVLNHMITIESALVERYSAEDGRRKENEIDAFLAVKKSFLRNRNTDNPIIGALTSRTKLYNLDGDHELEEALSKVEIKKIETNTGKKLVSSLPEIAYQLKITKEELFSAIREWSSETPSGTAKENRDRIKAQLPYFDSTRFDLTDFMRKLAEQLPMQDQIENSKAN